MPEPTLITDEAVELAVPATAAHLRHVRVLAATVADDAGLDVEAIESLRLAVDELCALAVGDATPGAQLRIRLGVVSGALVLDGTCGPVADTPEVDPIAASILAAGADEHDLRVEDGTCLLSLRVRLPGSHGAA